MKFKGFDLLVAVVLVGCYGLVRNGVSLLLVLSVFLLYLFVRFRFATAKQTPTSLEDENNIFVDNRNDKYQSFAHIRIDVDFNGRPLPGYFLCDGRFDTSFGKSLYEYRIDGTNVFCRLIENEQDDVDASWHDVRDGVVQETAIRKFYEVHSWRDVDDKIKTRKSQVEWHSLVSWGFHGVKYFILAKNLPKADARRFFRQELERLRLGTAAFLKEAGRYGLEPDDSLDGLRVRDGKSTLAEILKKTNDSTPSFCDDYLEFSQGRNLPAQLEKLLGD